NNGVQTFISPPQAFPQLDVLNFVNNGLFVVSNSFFDNINFPTTFQTSDTVNWTNHNRMVGDSGFRFENFDTGESRWRRSANFVNQGLVNETNASIFGATYIQVRADNIINRGGLTVGATGLLELKG